MAKLDIENREDIIQLVNTFYEKVLSDDVIGFFFSDVVAIDFKKHMPVMHDFWETTLLGNRVYKGNPMIKHIRLNEKAQIEKKHFDQWLFLWNETVMELFAGKIAELAISRASSIALLMQHKIS